MLAMARQSSTLRWATAYCRGRHSKPAAEPSWDWLHDRSPVLQVYHVNWNMVRRNLFLSASWDDTAKLWDLDHQQSLATFAEHTYCVYAASW